VKLSKSRILVLVALFFSISINTSNAMDVEECSHSLAKLEHQLNETTLNILLSKVTNQDNERSINNILPKELLVMILSFLSPEQVTQALFVCKKWFQLYFNTLGERFRVDHKFYTHIITKAMQAKKKYHQLEKEITTQYLKEHGKFDRDAKRKTENHLNEISWHLRWILVQKEINVGTKLLLCAALFAAGLSSKVVHSGSRQDILKFFFSLREQILEEEAEKNGEHEPEINENYLLMVLSDELTTRMQALAIACCAMIIKEAEYYFSTEIYKLIETLIGKIKKHAPKKELEKLLNQLFNDYYIILNSTALSENIVS